MGARPSVWPLSPPRPNSSLCGPGDVGSVMGGRPPCLTRPNRHSHEVRRSPRVGLQPVRPVWLKKAPSPLGPRGRTQSHAATRPLLCPGHSWSRQRFRSSGSS